MSISDPISDLLTRIRNAIDAKHPRVDVPGSKIKNDIVDILRDEGFIRGYKIFENENKKTIRIYLKYSPENEPIVFGIKRISKPGRRIYQKWEEIKPIHNNIGISILSTSKGVMTGKQALKAHIGGEVIAHIW